MLFFAVFAAGPPGSAQRQDLGKPKPNASPEQPMEVKN